MRMGRPRAGQEVRPKTLITFNADIILARSFKDRAKRLKLSQSEYIRKLIQADLQNEAELMQKAS